MAKGKLLIIGGAEDKGEDIDHQRYNARTNVKFERFEILKEIAPSSSHQKIEVITTGSRVPEEVKRSYQRAFERIGYSDPGFILIKNKLQAQNKKYLSRIEAASAIFFSGGDQFRLSAILGGTPIIDLIKQRYAQERDFLIAGTSAGAMVLANLMIMKGGSKKILLGNTPKISAGFGFLPNCIIDTHFMDRNRFARLAHAVTINPGQLGIGLGEDTALIISDGSEAQCLGSGMVVIIDGKKIKRTNITEALSKESVFVENLIVHLLVKGCQFSLKSLQFID